MSQEGVGVLQAEIIIAINRCKQEWDITVAEAAGVMAVISHGIIHEAMEQEPDEDAIA